MRRLACLLALSLCACNSEDKPAAPADAGPSFDFSDARAYAFEVPQNVTDGLVVMVDGRVVFEAYGNGFTEKSRHILYSASKSIGSALVGIAVADGLIARGDSVCKHVTPPAGADPTLCDTTLEHLLFMSSGLRWVESYDEDPNASDVLPMLYGNWTDMGAYVAARPREVPTGKRFSYSSGDSNLLARAIRGALGGKDMRAWAKEKLFDPAGITSAVFEVDRSGTLVFSSSCFMTTRDLARFGQLYLQGGTIDGRRVLSEQWVKFSATPAPILATPTPRAAGDLDGNSGGSYGAQWWLNSTGASSSPDTWRWPDIPADTFSGDGHWGQRVIVIPSRKTVIARVGNDRDKPFNAGPLIVKVLAALEKGGAK
jgi:CubicO group peptidase (beta-lactamase class C family)